jgi:glycyl-tRNA synthetase
VGIRPRGAADPWGLRRAAFGLVQLLVEKGLSLPLPEALSLTAEVLPVDTEGQVLNEVYDYVLRRYRGYLLDRGYRYDLVDAVLNERGYDLYLAYETLNALTKWGAREDWQALLDSYARCVRITRDQASVHPIQPDRFVEPAALSLYDAYSKARREVQEAQTLDSLMMAIEQLKPAITRFFEDVLVMDKEPTLRNNRLALLKGIGALAEGIVDLSVVEGF